MKNFNILLITLFCIVCSFFIGYFFGQTLMEQEIETMKKNLQISLDIHGNTIDVQKSHSDIRVIVDGKVLSGTGNIEIRKE